MNNKNELKLHSCEIFVSIQNTYSGTRRDFKEIIQMQVLIIQWQNDAHLQNNYRSPNS